MNRRDFLAATSAVAGGAAASGTAAAQQGTSGGGNATGGNATGGNGTAGGNQTAGGSGGGGGGTQTVELVDYAYNPGTESPLVIAPGTTVKFVWNTGGHNIHVDQQPDGANWSGHESIEDSGFTYTHTFQTTGKYHYWCTPHKSQGMVADIQVKQGGASASAASGGGATEPDPEEMGVPLQAHFVGIATVLMMVVSLIYTFFVVKYGESPNAKGGN